MATITPVNTKAQSLLATIRAETQAKKASATTTGTTGTTGTTTTKAENVVEAKPVAPDYTSQINAVSEAQKAARIASLDKSRQTALANLETEKSAVQPTYYNARNRESARGLISAKSLGSYLAQRGLSRSGDYERRILENDNTTKAALGQLDSEEAQAYANIAKRKTDTENAYLSDVESAKSSIEANKLEQIMNATQNQYATALNQYNTDRTYNQTAKQNEIKNYVDSISGLGDQFDYDAEIQKITKDGDTSNDWKISYLKQERQKKIDSKLQNEINTISQYYNDYDAEIQRRASIDPNDPLIPYLQAERQKKVSAIENAQAEAEQKQTEALTKHYLEIFKQTGIVNTDEMAQYLGLQKGTYSLDYAKTLYDTSKPYYSPNSGSGGSSSSGGGKVTMKDTIADIKSHNYNVAELKAQLEANKSNLVDQFDESGYKKIYNDVLGWAIKNGQALALE